LLPRPPSSILFPYTTLFRSSLLGGGGDAEYALAKENQAATKPATISFTEAAGVPSVALTAWQALVDKANIQSGQTVLIHGASGGDRKSTRLNSSHRTISYAV